MPCMMRKETDQQLSQISRQRDNDFVFAGWQVILHQILSIPNSVCSY